MKTAVNQLLKLEIVGTVLGKRVVESGHNSCAIIVKTGMDGLKQTDHPTHLLFPV